MTAARRHVGFGIVLLRPVTVSADNGGAL